MPELKRFAVFGKEGRLGTLAAPARFLDNRSEKTIELDKGGELSVPADSLEVQADGSFFLRETPKQEMQMEQPPSERAIEPVTVHKEGDGAALTELDGIGHEFYQEGYTIERVKVERLVTEPVSQRQEGDTLILPVVEEVLVLEKRLMLREEIRITRKRDPVKEVRRIDSSLH